jgi:hypothetical protein
MPRFHQGSLDHRLDNQIGLKRDLRFTEQSTAEDYATSLYLSDSVPRSVIEGTMGGFVVLENPQKVFHPHEVFYINSTPCEG